MPKANKLEKIDSALQQEIAKICNYELNDPRIKSMISILSVKTDNDLFQSVVNVSVYSKNQEDNESTFKALKSSEGYIRKLLSGRLRIRTVPQIIFKLDTSMEYSDKINKILSTLNIKNDETSNTDKK
jgi:ribosome-binding factor A